MPSARPAAPAGGCVPAALSLLQANADSLLLVFRAQGAEVPVTVPLQPHTARALRHLYGLMGHTCDTPPQVHIGLLLRAVEAVGGAVTRIVVRPGPEPAFWLRLGDRDSWSELPLDVLDAASLLLSRRVPVALVPTPEATWDTALVRLIEGDGS